MRKIAFLYFLVVSVKAQALSTGCINNDHRFVFSFDGIESFEEAEAFCETPEFMPNNETGALASVRNLQDFEEITSLLDNTTEDIANYWLGIRKDFEIDNFDELNSEIETRPQTMFFTDGFEDNSFFSVGGQFPWSVDLTTEPNGDGDFCVFWARRRVFIDFDSWDDSNCLSAGVTSRPLCRTECVVSAVEEEEEEEELVEEEGIDFVLLGIGASVIIVLALVLLVLHRERRALREMKVNLSLVNAAIQESDSL